MAMFYKGIQKAYGVLDELTQCGKINLSIV